MPDTSVHKILQGDESSVTTRLVERCFLGRDLGSGRSGVHAQQYGPRQMME